MGDYEGGRSVMGSLAVEQRRVWGARLKAWRHAQNWSQTELAGALAQEAQKQGVQVWPDDRLVRRWETGKGVPEQRYRRLLAEIGAPRVPESLLRVLEVDPLRRRAFLGAVASAVAAGSSEPLLGWWPETVPSAAGGGGRIGAGEVMRIERLTAGMRRMSGELGGTAVVGPANAALEGSTGLLERASSDRVRAQCALALADLAYETGWAHHDSGEQELALERMAVGLRWALDARGEQAARAASMRSHLVFGMARVALHRGDPLTGLTLAQLGQIPAAEVADRASAARLHTATAWAFAMMGHAEEAVESLARARHDMERASGEQARYPWLAQLFAAGEIAGVTALVYSTLAAHTTDQRIAESSAAIAVEQTVASFAVAQARSPRSLVFDRISAAQSLLRVGDVDAGIAMAEAVRDGVEEIASRRVLDRLSGITAAAAPHAGSATVAELIAELDRVAQLA